jgi:hypothetical protein
MATTLMCDLLSLISDKHFTVQPNFNGELTQLNLEEDWVKKIGRSLLPKDVKQSDLQNIQDAIKECKAAILKNCDESYGTVGVPSISLHHAGNNLPDVATVTAVIGDVADVTAVMDSFRENQSGGVGSHLIPRGSLVHPSVGVEGVVSVFVVQDEYLVGIHFSAPVDPVFVKVAEAVECEYEECLEDEDDDEDECEEECGLGTFRLLV